VEHSPIDSPEFYDPRWPSWYAEGLQSTLRRCQLFVIVLEKYWDSSTWMAEEANFAMTMPQVVQPLPSFFWNPTKTPMTAHGMRGYLKTELPVGIYDAVKVLLNRQAA